MKQETVTVPELGGADTVEVIEISVAVGDRIAVDQSLVTLESDKASMEVPSPAAGTVTAIALKNGDKVRQGDPILTLETAAEAAPSPPAPVAKAAAAPPAIEPQPKATATASPPPAATSPGSGAETRLPLVIPDLGGADSVEVVEVSVRVGDVVTEGAALLVVEGDKASMEIPSPAAGTITAIDVKAGARVKSGDRIGELTTTAPQPGAVTVVAEPAAVAAPATAAAPVAGATPLASVAPAAPEGDAITAINRVLEKERQTAQASPFKRETRPGAETYAGPAVRVLAREFGVSLAAVTGSGPKGRILKEDVQGFVKTRLVAPAGVAGVGVPAVPVVDFAAFGAIETVALNGVQKATVVNMARSWLNVPHVTQFDLADVTELESFRESLKPEMDKRGNKLTPVPFLLMAVARALREHPRVNSSLHPDGVQLVLKKYVHIGVAVDTPQGLMVPVIRDVNAKSVWEIATEARELADRARARKLKLSEMQGASFTVSSLGNIGGEGFTPIVNTPEVAILGVSRLAVRPVWNGKEFLPRKTLPLSLSYDHRVINGADAGNFLTYLVSLMADIRRLLL